MLILKALTSRLGKGEQVLCKINSFIFLSKINIIYLFIIKGELFSKRVYYYLFVDSLQDKSDQRAMIFQFSEKNMQNNE